MRYKDFILMVPPMRFNNGKIRKLVPQEQRKLKFYQIQFQFLNGILQHEYSLFYVSKELKIAHLSRVSWPEALFNDAKTFPKHSSRSLISNSMCMHQDVDS